MKKRLLDILFWSVISAAFIGPGTITTAASAGAGYGFTLVWALVFSTLACVVLQEASARLTLASGRNLGEAIRHRFFSVGLGGRSLAYLVLVSILLGCAAYEAGNILGAVAGAGLVFKISPFWLTLVIGIAAFMLLWFNRTDSLARILGFIVAFMGICFLSTAILIQPDLGSLFAGSCLPRAPSGSELLLIGLIGTTVVPYNLFLGSGLKHAQNMKEMRFSLTTAIVLGGIVSIAVLIVGSSITGEFSYESLSLQLSDSLGGWASWFFGFGLFSAGISSAITAPLAASITARSILSESESRKWGDQGPYFRGTWAAVLVIGVLFGVTEIQPIPAIILAQALNGIILPIVAVFLLLMVNDSGLLDSRAINPGWYNLLMGAIVFISILIGLTNVAKALSRVGLSLVHEDWILGTSLAVSLLISWPVIRWINKNRSIDKK